MSSALTAGQPAAIEPPSVAAELDLPRPVAHGWVAVLWLIYLVDMADRQAIVATFPALKAAFQLSDAQLGLVGSILGLSLAVLVVPIGRLADLYSRPRIIAAMVALWSLATWATGLARGFGDLVMARLVVGAGEAGYNPSAYSLIAAWFPQRLRATMVGFFNSAQPLGAVVGVGLGGWIAATYGWQAVFGALAVPGLLLAVAALFAPDYRTKKVRGEALVAADAGARDTLRYIADTRTLLALYLSQATAALAATSLTTWGPSFYGRAFGLDMAQAGQVVMFSGLVAFLGAPAGGWLSDRLNASTPSGRVLVATGCLVGSLLLFGASMVSALQGGPLTLVAVLWASGQFCMAGSWGSVVSAVLDLVPPHYRGLAQSFIPLAQASTGFWGAGLVGAISDQIGLAPALLIVVTFGLAMSIAILGLAARTHEGDLARVRQLGSFIVDRV